VFSAFAFVCKIREAPNNPLGSTIVMQLCHKSYSAPKSPRPRSKSTVAAILHHIYRHCLADRTLAWHRRCEQRQRTSQMVRQFGIKLLALVAVLSGCACGALNLRPAARSRPNLGYHPQQPELRSRCDRTIQSGRSSTVSNTDTNRVSVNKLPGSRRLKLLNFCRCNPI